MKYQRFPFGLGTHHFLCYIFCWFNSKIRPLFYYDFRVAKTWEYGVPRGEKKVSRLEVTTFSIQNHQDAEAGTPGPLRGLLIRHRQARLLPFFALKMYRFSVNEVH